MKVTNSLTMNGKFESIEDVHNSTFLRTKIKVFALGQNANGSAFSADSFASAKKSLSLIPIVAKFTDTPDVNGKDGDLTGHNVELREVDGEYDLFHDTYPIGVISNTSNITIEEVNEGTELNPVIKQYIVADEVYLWRRYDATKKIEEWIGQGVVPKLSMEIGNVEGKFNEDGYFQIENFEFEAVAALGSDVTPCFPSAEITTYSKKEFKDELKELVFELNKTLETELEGGNTNMAKETKETKLEDANLEKVDTKVAEEVVESVEAVESDYQKETTETPETKVEETKEDTEVESTDTPQDTPEQTKDDSEQVTTEESKDAPDEAQEVTEDVTNEDVPKVEEVDFEAKYIQLADAHSLLQTDFDTNKTELETLQSYKRQREENDLKEKFSGKLSDEEFQTVFTDLKSEDLEKVEEKLFALIGKKNFSITSTDVKTEVNKVKINNDKKKESSNPYDALFTAYLEK